MSVLSFSVALTPLPVPDRNGVRSREPYPPVPAKAPKRTRGPTQGGSGVTSRFCRTPSRVRRHRVVTHNRRGHYSSARAGHAADLDLVPCRSSLCAHLGWAYRVLPCRARVSTVPVARRGQPPVVGLLLFAPVVPVTCACGRAEVGARSPRSPLGDHGTLFPFEGADVAAARCFRQRQIGSWEDRTGTVALRAVAKSWSVLLQPRLRHRGTAGRDRLARGRVQL